jgi:hypothetical protein
MGSLRGYRLQTPALLEGAHAATPPSCAQFRPGESANPSISLQTGIDAMSLTFGDLVIYSDKANAQTA